jgi:hypothetical protein
MKMQHPYVKYAKLSGLPKLLTAAVLSFYHILLYGFWLLLWLWFADRFIPLATLLAHPNMTGKHLAVLAFRFLPPVALSIITVHLIPLIFGRPKGDGKGALKSFREYLFISRINCLYKLRLISTRKFISLIETHYPEIAEAADDPT